MPKNAKANESVLHLATKEGGTLRATLPSFIVNQLELKPGDRIRWILDGKRIIAEPQKGQE